MEKKSSEAPTQERIKEILLYDQETGLFTWKARPRSEFPSDRAWNAFNTNFVGKVAGYTSDDGYIRVKTTTFSARAHRLAWLYTYGSWPIEIDHIDGNRSNNSLLNLREVNRRENSRNRCVRSDNTTGAVGVYRDEKNKSGERWNATISDPEGKRILLGRFVHYEDAVFARKIAEKCFGYHPNHGRAASGEA
jgi:hypothetical protein